MDVFIFLLLTFSFLFGILFFVLKTVSKTHTKINTFNFGITSNHPNYKEIRKRDFNLNIFFYSLLIVVALISTVIHASKDIVDDEIFFDYLFRGLQFQLVSAILFILISFFNPFIVFPEVIVEKIQKRGTFLRYIIANTQQSFYIRVFLLLVIVAFFVIKKWLVFIPLYTEIKFLQGINILLLFYLCKNIYYMKSYPLDFLLLNLLRLVNGVLYLKIFAFVLAPLAPITMLTLHFLGFDEQQFPFWTLLFVVFNSILIFLEIRKKQTLENPIVQKKEKKKKKKRKKKRNDL